MQTLLYTSVLGLLCLALEILDMRKVLVPFVLAGLAVIFCMNYMEWDSIGAVMMGGIDMSNMMDVSHYSVAFGGELLHMRPYRRLGRTFGFSHHWNWLRLFSPSEHFGSGERAPLG